MGLEHKPVRFFWTELYLKKTKVNPALHRFVVQLKKQGYKLGVISNTAGSHVRDNRNGKRLAHFDNFVYSNEVGVTKPNKKLYDLILKKMKVKASECVFIDDVAAYLVPAQKMGMHTVHFQNARHAISKVKQILKTETFK